MPKDRTMTTATNAPSTYNTRNMYNSLDTLAVAVTEASSGHESTHEGNLSTVAPKIPESLVVATKIRRGRPRRSDGPAIDQMHAATLSESYQQIVDQIAHDASGDNGGRRRQFVCTVSGCGKVFYQRAHLNIHIRSHTGYKPYMCQYPGCGKTFTQLGNMRTHERRHTGDRPFKCHVLQCQKAFTQAGNLKTHLRKVHSIESSPSSRSAQRRRLAPPNAPPSSTPTKIYPSQNVYFPQPPKQLVFPPTSQPVYAPQQTISPTSILQNPNQGGIGNLHQ